jgi:polygalacturonase
MKEYNIENFGANANQLSTKAIQDAINQCAIDGGGVVAITHGTYISGTLFMKSNVHLRIDAGAKLLMSDNIDDFPDFPCEWNVKAAPRYSARCLIYVGNCENVSIGGLGMIDCNGSAFCEENPKPIFSETDPFLCKRMKRKLDYDNTPGRMIFVMKSKNITLSDFTMTEMAGGWGIWVNGCEYVNIHNLKLYCV